MTDDNHMDDGDESASSTRRELLKGGAVGLGLLALGSGGVSAQTGVGGGPASDEMAHLRQLVYGGPLGERADPGVDGRVYWADDGTIAKDDGSGWQKPDLQGLGSVGTESVGINPETVRVYGIGPDGAVGTFEDRKVGDFADIGALLQSAHDDVQSSSLDGGVAIIPPGSYTYGTTPTFRTNFVPSAPHHSPPSLEWNGDGYAPVELVYTGSGNGMEWVPLSNDAADRIHALGMRGIKLRPENADGGTHGVLIDGNTGLVSGGQFWQCQFDHWGGDGVRSQGTVFDMDFMGTTAFKNNDVGIRHEYTPSDAAAGEPTGWHFRGCRVNGDDGDASSWGVDVRSNQISWHGGMIAAQDGAQNGAKLNPGTVGSVTVSGAQVEGDDDANTIGLKIPACGEAFISSQVSRWDTGVELGGNGDTKNATIGGSYTGNVTEDVKILAGQDRDGTEIVPMGLTVTDERASVDDVGDVVGHRKFNARTTVSFDVSTTGIKTNTPVWPVFAPEPDAIEINQISSTNQDFSISAPTIDATSLSGNVDVTLEVLTASANGSATVTFELRGVLYSYSPS